MICLGVMGGGPLVLSAASTARKATKTAADPVAAGATVAPGKEYVYPHSGGKPQKLEVYFPPNWSAAGPKVPGVLLFHGGGWSGGDLAQFRYACRYLASRGLVAATADVTVRATPNRVVSVVVALVTRS